MAKVIGFLNNKGGVGKSSLVGLIAAALALRGNRILCVDMDPQANLTRRLGYSQQQTKTLPTLAEAIKADDPGCAADIIVPCLHGDDVASRIDLAPSRFDLEKRETEAGIVGAKSRLARVMEGVTDPYDYVLTDFRPSLGHLSQMAMVFVGQHRKTRDGMKPGKLALVSTAEYDSMLGAQMAVDFVKEYRTELAVPDLDVAAVIVNMVRKAGVHAENLGNLEEAFGQLIVKPYLPLWSVLTDADNNAEPLRSFRTARARELTTKVDEVASRLEELV